MTFPARICILGGGTAGWLSALVLQDAARRTGAASEITVIESSRFGVIGVGEGTTAAFRILLRHLGIDEAAFLREIGGTFKLGIRHRDWRRLGHHYDGPIDDPHQVAGLGRGSLLDAHQVAEGRPVQETHLFQHLIDGSRSPYARKADGGIIPAGPQHHAFHFDQARAGQFLRKCSHGVTVIDDQVTSVETGENGIAALLLESGQRVSADLYIDCSGFRRVLVGALDVPFESYRPVLPITRALPFWLDIDDDDPVRPVTGAWAQGNGWMWQIPTQGRYGCGYVFSDAHISMDQAKAEIEAALGKPVEPRGDIRINAGRLRQNWTGNCVALGLASSFIEPLEATSIHGTVVQLLWLSEALAGKMTRDAYNAAAARQVDDYRDFVRMHYVSERRDTAFWRDIATSHPTQVTDRLATWQRRVPVASDFSPLPLGLPHCTEQLYTPVLNGLGLIPRSAGRATLPQAMATRTAATAKALISEYRAAAPRCLSHRDYLSHLQQDVPA